MRQYSKAGRYDTKLNELWDGRWIGSEESERLTPVGRLMFKAKTKRLNQVVSGLPIISVIEVGCGLGYTLALYQKMGLNCMGVDISPHAIHVCEKKGLNVVLKDVKDVNESYDLVSSDGMLEHFLNFEPYAKLMMKISNKYVLLIQPNHDSFYGKTLAYLAELFRSNENVHEFNYRIIDFISIFETNGFRILKNLPIFYDVFRLLLFGRTSL